MQQTPPREGVRSRLGHVSIEDFALALGTSKQPVIQWLKGNAYPDQVNRRRLAAASGGRYTPDDFKREAEPSILARLAALEETAVRAEDVGRLERVFREAIESLASGDAQAALRVLSELDG